MINLRFSTNIISQNCLAAVTPHIEKVQNMLKWRVDLDHPEKILSVLGTDIHAESVIKAVSHAGFKAVLIEQEGQF